MTLQSRTWRRILTQTRIVQIPRLRRFLNETMPFSQAVRVSWLFHARLYERVYLLSVHWGACVLLSKTYSQDAWSIPFGLLVLICFLSLSLPSLYAMYQNGTVMRPLTSCAALLCSIFVQHTQVRYIVCPSTSVIDADYHPSPSGCRLASYLFPQHIPSADICSPMRQNPASRPPSPNQGSGSGPWCCSSSP